MLKCIPPATPVLSFFHYTVALLLLLCTPRLLAGFMASVMITECSVAVMKLVFAHTQMVLILSKLGSPVDTDVSVQTF